MKRNLYNKLIRTVNPDRPTQLDSHSLKYFPRNVRTQSENGSHQNISRISVESLTSGPFSGYYIVSVYQDQMCSNLIYVGIQQLNVCYQQQAVNQGGRPIYLKSVLVKSGGNYTNIDTYYSDSQCTKSVVNSTVTYGPTPTTCGSFGGGYNGYFSTGSVMQQLTAPSLSSAIYIGDYQSATCASGVPVEAYYFNPGSCVLNTYLASCGNSGPVLSLYDASSSSFCAGRAAASYQLSASCSTSIFGSARYEYTSGCSPLAVASIGSVIALFLGILLTICCCTTIAYGIVKMIFTRARMRQQVVVLNYHDQYYRQFGNAQYMQGQYGNNPYGVHPNMHPIPNQMGIHGGGVPIPYTVAEATFADGARGDVHVPVATAEAVVADSYGDCPQSVVQVFPGNGLQYVSASNTGPNFSSNDHNNSNANTSMSNSNNTQYSTQVPQAQAEPVRISTYFRIQ